MKKTNITHASNEVTPNAFQALLVGNPVFKNLASNMDTKLLIRFLKEGVAEIGKIEQNAVDYCGIIGSIICDMTIKMGTKLALF